jgi:hypothetical protein
MAWWRVVADELSALGMLAASMPLGLLVRDGFDPTAPHPTPVVLVHGLGGARPNFLALRSFLASRGIRNFASPRTTRSCRRPGPNAAGWSWSRTAGT